MQKFVKVNLVIAYKKRLQVFKHLMVIYFFPPPPQCTEINIFFLFFFTIKRKKCYTLLKHRYIAIYIACNIYANFSLQNILAESCKRIIVITQHIVIFLPSTVNIYLKKQKFFITRKHRIF